VTEAAIPLDQMQRWMHEALRAPGGPSDERVAALVAPPGQLDPAGALAIYQRSYYQRLLSCMREQFPALRHALGEDLFTDFAREYLRAHPPQSYTLYDLGRRFPGYLEASRPDREAAPGQREIWIDFMVDLAGFERLVFTLFDGPGHEGKPFADTGAADADLRPQPAFALGHYRFPVAVYYHAVREEKSPELPPLEPSHVALVRVDFLTRTVPLGPVQHAFLRLIQETGTVPAAMTALCAERNLAPEAVERSWSEPGGVRERWIEAGFFMTDGAG
jgi:hypothetical protein